MKEGIVFDIKKYAIHDGPGIRTTVFFKGCPLKCRWCHNPEGVAISPEVIYRKDRCIGCGECINACPEDAITRSPQGMITNPSNCLRCGLCAESCPAEARELIGRVMTVEDVLREIEKDVLFYDESGGGVTFSGGEPLMQPDFLLGLLDASGRLGIHRVVDTTGYADSTLLLEVAEKTELFLYDLKQMDSDKHQKYTGVPNERILNNLELLVNQKAMLKIRVPIIPGVNCDDENIDGLGAFVSTLSGVTDIDVLPYHNTAKNKYRRFGIEDRAGEVLPPSASRIRSIVKRLEGFGLRVKVGG
jgi:pyruvate formate lyase activating enzyme